MRGVLIVGGVLLVVLIAGWIWWLGPALRKGREEQAAVRKLKGFTKLRKNWSGRVVSVSLEESNDEAVKKLVELDPTEMYDLRVADSRLSDDSLKKIGGLTRLRGLDLAETHVSDGGIDLLVEMKQLQRLNLTGTGVKFEDVKRIEKAIPGISVRH